MHKISTDIGGSVTGVTPEAPATEPVSQHRWIAALPMPLRSLMKLRTLGAGSAEVELRSREWMGGLIGAAAIVADDALCMALASSYPPRHIAITIELTVDLVRSPAVLPRTLVGYGDLVVAADDNGFARGTVEDPDGVVLAETSLRALVLPHEGDDPPPQAAAEEPSPSEPLRAIPYLANPRGVVHGGVLTMVGARAASEALAPNPLAGIRAVLTRPFPADGAPFETTAAVVHAGRRLGLVDVAVKRMGAVAASLVATSLAGQTPESRGRPSGRRGRAVDAT